MNEAIVSAAKVREEAAIKAAATAMALAICARSELDAEVGTGKSTNPMRMLGDRLRKRANEAAMLAQVSQCDAEKRADVKIETAESVKSDAEALVVVGNAMSVHEVSDSDAATEDSWQLV